MPTISFKIEKNCGKLSQSGSGWTKELNIVRWNERDPKYDLRDWSPTHERMGRGITFTKDELVELKRILESLTI